MEENGGIPDNSSSCTLIINLSIFGRLKDGREVFEDMPKQRVTLDVNNT